MEWIFLILGAVLGYLVAWCFYRKSTADLKAEFARQLRQFEECDTLDHFEQMLVTGTWSKEDILTSKRRGSVENVRLIKS
jgi:hypothetical protein